MGLIIGLIKVNNNLVHVYILDRVAPMRVSTDDGTAWNLACRLYGEYFNCGGVDPKPSQAETVVIELPLAA